MDYQSIVVLVAFLSQLTTAYAFNPLAPKDDKCESLKYDICRQMEYNRTIFPNYLGHRKQSEAILSVSVLRPLLAVRCSPDVLTFLCSVYFPMCTSINKLIPPCRELCVSVEKDCSHILKRFNYAWPDELKCDQFPKVRTEICVFHNKTGPRPTLPLSFTLPPTPKLNKVRSRKPVQKYCPAERVKNNKWNSKPQKTCCKCCQRGTRAARGGVTKCTLKKVHGSLKTFAKTKSECQSRKSKRCYVDCCNAKRRELQKTKSKTRRNRNRRNRNRRQRRRPVG